MYFVHDVPGRLRVKIRYLKNNPHRLNVLCNQLKVPGVYKIKPNRLTGSIVIEYDPLAVGSKSLLKIFQANGHNVYPKQSMKAAQNKDHEKRVITAGKAMAGWLAGQVLEANGLGYIAAFI